MNRFLYAAAGLALVACGYSEEKFEDDLVEAMCEWTVKCYEDLYADVDECIDDNQSTDTDTEEWECEDYDSKAAKDCVQQTEEMACPGAGEFPVFPSVCGDVCSNTGDTGE